MKPRTAGGLPVLVLILDVIGTALLAVGLLAFFSGPDGGLAGFGFLRPFWIAFVVVGVLLMLPLLMAIVRRASARE